MNGQVLQKVALRYRAIFLPVERDGLTGPYEPTVPLMAFVKRLKENGYSVSEELLYALAKVPAKTLGDITLLINEALGVDLNWMPLVKGWDTPTGETRWDHLITFLTNLFGGEEAGFKGITLPCGHFIPDGTFPLERYTGCPFCGKPFQTADFVYRGQGSKLRLLQLWGEEELLQFMGNLLASPVALDATQRESLVTLLESFQFTVHSSQFSVHSSQFSVLSSQFIVHSSQLYPQSRHPCA